MSKQRRTPKTQLPLDFALTEELRQYAYDEGVPEDEIERQFGQFRAFYAMRGEAHRSAVWGLVWAYWCHAAGSSYRLHSARRVASRFSEVRYR